jgi:hypothetical protein
LGRPWRHLQGEGAEVDLGRSHGHIYGHPGRGQVVRHAPAGIGARLPRVHLNEGQAIFSDGHVRALEHFGGYVGEPPRDESHQPAGASKKRPSLPGREPAGKVLEDGRLAGTALFRAALDDYLSSLRLGAGPATLLTTAYDLKWPSASTRRD